MIAFIALALATLTRDTPQIQVGSLVRIKPRAARPFAGIVKTVHVNRGHVVGFVADANGVELQIEFDPRHGWHDHQTSFEIEKI